MKRANYIQLNSNYIQLHTFTSNYIQLYSISYVSSVSSRIFGPRTLRRPRPIEGVPAAPTIYLVYLKFPIVSPTSNLTSAPSEIPGRKRYPRARTAGAMSTSMSCQISTGRRDLVFSIDVSISCEFDLLLLA